VRPGLIVVACIRSKKMPTMLLAKYEDIVKAVSSGRGLIERGKNGV